MSFYKHSRRLVQRTLRGFLASISILLVIGFWSVRDAEASGPQAVLTPTSVLFADTTVGQTSADQTVTLTNPGTATLKISSVTLIGADLSDFALTNACGKTLAKGKSCAIRVRFTPVSVAGFSGTIKVADSAPGSPHTVALSGTGTSGTGSGSSTQSLVIEPDQGMTPIYNLLNSAQKSIDMTMYELVDTQCQQILAQQATKGVAVRVILDQSLEKTSNTPAYTFLNANGVKAVWSNPAFQASHQKTITIDGKTTAIMTLNLTSRYYSTSRDFAVIEDNANDIAAIEATFNADFASASITPSTGDDLIWSPTTALNALLGLISSAKTSLRVENEEMGDAQIVTALEDAAKRGVAVEVAMTNGGTYTTEFNALKAAGVKVNTYVTTAPLYIHAKIILVDYGQSGQVAFVGSENFSNPSLTENRELGLTVTDPSILGALNTTFGSDFQGGTPWP
jgi:cardiolipin synthase A/B